MNADIQCSILKLWQRGPERHVGVVVVGFGLAGLTGKDAEEHRADKKAEEFLLNFRKSRQFIPHCGLSVGFWQKWKGILIETGVRDQPLCFQQHSSKEGSFQGTHQPTMVRTSALGDIDHRTNDFSCSLWDENIQNHFPGLKKVKQRNDKLNSNKQSSVENRARGYGFTQRPPSFYRSAAPESWAHLHNPSDYMWLGDAEQVPGGGKADYKAQWIDNSVDDFILHVRMPAFSIQISNVTFSNGWSYFLSEKTLKMTMF